MEGNDPELMRQVEAKALDWGWTIERQSVYGKDSLVLRPQHTLDGLSLSQVNEEVDALTGFGISPMDVLVLPRVLGLAIMTPLLTIYSNIAGITGGFLVGVLMLGITPAAYLANTLSFMTMSYVWIGLLHAFVFGILIALCGCYQGIRSGRNASAVGRATTSAVVNSIVGIIVATSIITVIFTVVDL